MAPVERLSNYEQNNYKLSSAGNPQGNKNHQIQIFHDENGSVATGQQQEIVKKLPTSNNQENQSKAGRWCDNRIKSKPRLDQPQVTKFEIQEDQVVQADGQDDDAELKSKQANKLKELKKDDKEKSPRLVIFEKLAPNQRFYCDLKKIYCGGTEYSFEEIRSIRLKLAKKKEDERLTKEQLIREVQDLKKQISAKDHLVNDVEQMKKKLERLMKQNSKFKLTDVVDVNKSSGCKANDVKKADPIEQHCTSEKQPKLDANLFLNDRNDAVSKFDKSLTKNSDRPSTNCDAKVINQFSKDLRNDGHKDGKQYFHAPTSQQSNSPPNQRDFKEDLTIVRNLWNGSIEDEQTVDIEKEIVQQPKAGDFSIFKDDDLVNGRNSIGNHFNQQQFNQPESQCFGGGDLQNIQSTNFQTNSSNTFALPHGDFDFMAKHASTPASHFEQFQTSTTQLDENYTINVYQGRDNKLLSPIVETSKEYKSSSSSSLFSGFSSYHKSKTFHK